MGKKVMKIENKRGREREMDAGLLESRERKKKRNKENGRMIAQR